MIVCSFFLEGISVFVGRNLVTRVTREQSGAWEFSHLFAAAVTHSLISKAPERCQPTANSCGSKT